MTHTPELPPLEPLPSEWGRALVVVAHPDDIEYGAAAAIARWTAEGKQIAYCLVTSGEAGIDTMPPEEAGPAREAEERASAAIVGVTEVSFLGYPDGLIEYGVALRRDIARAIRVFRPDYVITGNFRDSFGGVMLNQSDHINTGRAVLDAARDAGNRWIFREHIDDEGLEPWKGVKGVWAGGSPEAGHGVDTTETFDLGVASLREHKAYLAALEGHPDPAEFLGEFGQLTGARMGVPYAAGFEVYPLQLL
jgi:LmbE family N-acetylglucosaminyl deacetylase